MSRALPLARIALSAGALVALSGLDAEGGGGSTGVRGSYDYNVPLALPPYGYTPGFWGYGGKRYYDRFGNYRKYQEPREGLYDGPVESLTPRRGVR